MKKEMVLEFCRRTLSYTLQIPWEDIPDDFDIHGAVKATSPGIPVIASPVLQDQFLSSIEDYFGIGGNRLNERYHDFFYPQTTTNATLEKFAEMIWGMVESSVKKDIQSTSCWASEEEELYWIVSEAVSLVSGVSSREMTLDFDALKAFEKDGLFSSLANNELEFFNALGKVFGVEMMLLEDLYYLFCSEAKDITIEAVTTTLRTIIAKFEKISGIVSKITGIPKSKIRMDSRMDSDLGLGNPHEEDCSEKILLLAEDVESEFGIFEKVIPWYYWLWELPHEEPTLGEFLMEIFKEVRRAKAVESPAAV